MTTVEDQELTIWRKEDLKLRKSLKDKNGEQAGRSDIWELVDRKLAQEKMEKEIYRECGQRISDHHTFCWVLQWEPFGRKPEVE